jgi:hypothetical protein
MVHICIMIQYAIDFLAINFVLNGKILIEHTYLYILLGGYANRIFNPD